ncbi:hypothetical protein BHE74_00000825 [Ensete ventricosum]|nr:hypothetical protein GW17_00007812 [Ensete ventricosum]RWW90033.1 hypothetical protein BHE74_00000825 [Ensete ventricosum]RZR87608.1 hypothetical protein BHM03_00015067 [Ensete ventricosum]
MKIACRPLACRLVGPPNWPRHSTDALCYSLSAAAAPLTHYVIACRPAALPRNISSYLPSRGTLLTHAKGRQAI